MRIIGGKLRGKKIIPPKDDKTRPLRDLVKESIFNLLNHSSKINFQMENSVILDLFSGSGSFGLECISRGAKFVFFNENYNEAIKVLEKNIHNLKCENKCKIIKNNCFNLTQNFEENVDLIFIDPPFKEEKINEIIEMVLKMKIIKKDGLIIIHRNKSIIENLSPRLKIIDIRCYGLSKIIFGN